MLISIIVPTYREGENLPHLVPAVSNALSKEGWQHEIVIVDDNSADATETACHGLAENYPIRLIVRRNERGLSSAVLRGMAEAKGDIFVVMDADLSHPPESVPHLVRALADDDADFVIGSRYVEGGGTDEDWGLIRWLNSRVATLLARPLTRAKDPMAGFFAIRRETFEAADELNPVGYKIGLELMVKCGCKKVREIPIHFQNRKFGESKLCLREQLNYLWHLARLMDYRFERWTCFGKFCAVGATGMVVDLSVYSLLLAALPLMVARALAIWVAMSWNFLLNRHFTFRHARFGNILHQYFLFCGSCLVGAVINWGTSIALTAWVQPFQAHPVLAAAVGVLAGTVFNYLFSRHITFKRTEAPVRSG